MTQEHKVTRRDLLRAGALTGVGVWLGCKSSRGNSFAGAATTGEISDEQFLDEIERASFEFFWREASSSTGQVKDRALLNGDNGSRPISSIAATGFGLTALCIADRRGYRKTSEIVERTRKTLRFLWHDMLQEHGFFYHFIDMNTGQREWKCEVSSIDTSLRRAHRAPAFRGRGNPGPHDQNLRACGLALDAERWTNVFHGLASGDGLHSSSLGTLLRIDDDLPTGDWLAHASGIS
jgi:hypothetical protein